MKEDIIAMQFTDDLILGRTGCSSCNYGSCNGSCDPGEEHVDNTIEGIFLSEDFPEPNEALIEAYKELEYLIED